VIFDEPLITSPLAMGLIVFACAFGGALLGLRLRANVIVLDRVMAHYGPETRRARGPLRDALAYLGR
jgi:hypothetical protein